MYLSIVLDGPMQSWGASSRQASRGTEHFPTQSGVFGLISSALGFTRSDPRGLEFLKGLETAIRVDAAGRVEKDFQIISGLKEHKHLSNRYYLHGAKFHCLVYNPQDSNDNRLAKIESALGSPWNQLFLGRKSCPPASPVNGGLVEADTLIDALQQLPYLGTNHKNSTSETLALHAIVPAEASHQKTQMIMDKPASYNSDKRLYLPRLVRETEVIITNPGYKKTTTYINPLDLVEA